MTMRDRNLWLIRESIQCITSGRRLFFPEGLREEIADRGIIRAGRVYSYDPEKLA
jgi:hypothetical protein